MLGKFMARLNYSKRLDAYMIGEVTEDNYSLLGDETLLATNIPAFKAKFAFIFLSLLASILLLEVAFKSVEALRGKGFLSNHPSLVHEPTILLTPFRTLGSILYAGLNRVRYISSRHGELYSVVKPEETFRKFAFGSSTTEIIER